MAKSKGGKLCRRFYFDSSKYLRCNYIELVDGDNNDDNYTENNNKQTNKILENFQYTKRNKMILWLSYTETHE